MEYLKNNIRDLPSRILLMLIVLSISISPACGTFNKKPFIYETSQGQQLNVTNKNISMFLRGVQVSSSLYETAQHVFVMEIGKAERAGDTERADLIYNRIKPIDDAVRASFKGLAASTSTTLLIAQESGGKHVPKALLDHAGDITILLGRLLPLAEEFGIDLPPAFDDVLNIMEVLAR